MRSRTVILTIAAAVASSTLLVTTASAGDYGSGSGPKVEVIASGLDNPRGLVVRYDTLYIAQAGKGGDGSLGCITDPEGGASCLGATGKVSSLKLAKGAAVKDLLTGLPSIGGQGTATDPAGSQAIGPSDVAIDGVGQVWLTIGLGGDPGVIKPALGGTNLVNIMGTEGKISGGKYVQRGDLAAFEAANDPDGVEVNSNPNSLVTTGGGSVFVADAGGNSLINVHGSGVAEVRGVFKETDLTEFPPGSGNMFVPDAVPTSVTRGPDGAFFIGELRGFPFLPNTANIYKIRAGGSTPRVWATGFTNVMDLAVLPSGEVLVLEIAANGLTDPGGPVGALYKVSADGKTSTELLGPDTPGNPLFAPGGIALDSTGKTAYISNLSVAAGGGQILKVTL